MTLLPPSVSVPVSVGIRAFPSCVPDDEGIPYKYIQAGDEIE